MTVAGCGEMSISVIVPACNSARTIGSCLKAIRESSLPPLEIIVVAATSTDETRQIALDHGAMVIDLPNSAGPGAARNVGALQAKGNVLVFIDSDVVIPKDGLKLVAEMFRQKPEAGAINGRLDASAPVKGYFSRYKNCYMSYIFSNLPNRIDFLFTSVAAIRRSSFVKFLETQRGEDTELGLRLSSTGTAIIYCNELKATHLKEYSLLSFYRNDFLIPYTWANIFLERFSLGKLLKKGRFAHASLTQIAGLGLAMVTLGTMLACALGSLSSWFPGIFLAASIALNAKFLWYLAQQQGFRFALCGIVVLFFDQIVMSLGVLAGTVDYLVRRKARHTADVPVVQATASPETDESFRPASSRWVLLGAGLIIVAVCAAYHNSFEGPFILDDTYAILENPSIRHLWPLWRALSPPWAPTVSGRPILNLSLAINYALCGTNVWGYHLINLAIHVMAALVLFGIVRRTLLLPILRDLLGSRALFLGLAVALIWAVHPLQTSAVTYVVQRAESLMGLFYLLTLYCVLRGATSRRVFLWYLGAVMACLLGMGTKEVMVSAPFMVLLYDRTFLAGSFREAWKRRWGLYLGLAATLGLPVWRLTKWRLLRWLLTPTALPNPTTGFATQQLTWNWSRYLLTQTGVIIHYLNLSLWPSGLCLDYGQLPPAKTLAEVLPAIMLTIGLLGLMAWALVKRPVLGFLLAWFFFILSPTSFFVPTLDPAFDHRVYLSLAAVVVFVVVGNYELWEMLLTDLVRDRLRGSVVHWVAPVVVLGAVVIALGYGTVMRNYDYRSEIAIWQDTVDKCQYNPRAHNNLGVALGSLGKIPEAIKHYERAVQLQPDFAEAYYNLGNELVNMGRPQEAIDNYIRALRFNPDFIEAYVNLASAYTKTHQSTEAIAAAQKALSIARSKNQTAWSIKIEDWLNSHSASQSSILNAPIPSKYATPPH